MDEVHCLVQDLVVTTQVPPVPVRNPARSPTVEAPNPLRPQLSPSSPPSSPIRRRNSRVSLPQAPVCSRTPEHPPSSGPCISIAAPSSPTETMSTSRASSPTQKRVSEFSFGGNSLRYSSSSYASSSDAGTSSTGWPNPRPAKDSFVGRNTSTMKTFPLPRTPELREPSHRADGRHLSLLPPPALGLATPLELERLSLHSSHTKLNPRPSSRSEITKLHRSSTTASQKAAFEKEAFRNGAILCDV
jgi:hypothetical protein